MKLTERYTLNIDVARYYTGVDGELLDKHSPLVPSVLKSKFPVFLFGEFDRQGGYRIGIQNSNFGGRYLMSFTNGVSLPFLSFTGFNAIKDKVNIGDIVHVFTDNLDAPQAFVWIVQTYQYGSLASVLANTKTTQKDFNKNPINIVGLNYFADFFRQFNNTIDIVTIDNLGIFQLNQINPLSFFNTKDQDQRDFIFIPFSFVLTQYLGLYVDMSFEANSLSFQFILKQ